MIMAGYSTNKSSDTYQFYNPMTRSIFKSRDVKQAEWETKALEPSKAFQGQEQLGEKKDESSEEENKSEEKWITVPITRNRRAKVIPVPAPQPVPRPLPVPAPNPTILPPANQTTPIMSN